MSTRTIANLLVRRPSTKGPDARERASATQQLPVATRDQLIARCKDAADGEEIEIVVEGGAASDSLEPGTAQ